VAATILFVQCEIPLSLSLTPRAEKKNLVLHTGAIRLHGFVLLGVYCASR
jgi:hypothetical protein